MNPGALLALVLVAGMTTMATEMSASRLLAPFFGSSVMVWANIIGLILIYLSLGYWYGGRVADRHPSARGLCTVTLLAATTIAIVPFAAEPVLQLASGDVVALPVSTVIGSFVGSVLLFSVPVTLLGMVPPYAVRLAITDVAHSGEVAGRLYAVSTIGSILGTFGSVLLFIPWIGTRRTMLAFALVLALLSLLGLWEPARRRLALAGIASALAIVGALIVPVGQVKGAVDGRVIFEQESRYQFVQVVERDDGTRLLQLNEGWAVHSLFKPNGVLTQGEWDHFLALPALTEHEQEADRMLVIGSAAGTTARMYRHYRPHVEIDAVEIDPLVSEVGRTYFDMRDDAVDPDAPWHVHDADGRPFLERSSESWDIVHIDAYRQPYIPFYLTTREFFVLVRDHLTTDGVVAINVGSVPQDQRINEAVAATMRDVFPSVYRYRAERVNELVVATMRPTTAAQLARRIEASELADEPDTRGLFDAFAEGLRPVSRDRSKVLTDDHAPVEWMTDRMIVGVATGDREDL